MVLDDLTRPHPVRRGPRARAPGRQRGGGRGPRPSRTTAWQIGDTVAVERGRARARTDGDRRRGRRSPSTTTGVGLRRASPCHREAARGARLRRRPATTTSPARVASPSPAAEGVDVARGRRSPTCPTAQRCVEPSAAVARSCGSRPSTGLPRMRGGVPRRHRRHHPRPRRGGHRAPAPPRPGRAPGARACPAATSATSCACRCAALALVGGVLGVVLGLGARAASSGAAWPSSVVAPGRDHAPRRSAIVLRPARHRPPGPARRRLLPSGGRAGPRRRRPEGGVMSTPAPNPRHPTAQDGADP